MIVTKVHNLHLIKRPSRTYKRTLITKYDVINVNH